MYLPQMLIEYMLIAITATHKISSTIKPIVFEAPHVINREYAIVYVAHFIMVKIITQIQPDRFLPMNVGAR